MDREYSRCSRVWGHSHAIRLYITVSRTVPLKEVHANKVPALVAWNHLRPDDHARLGLDVEAIMAKVERMRPHAPQLAEKARQVYARQREAGVSDVDASVYDGFLGAGDRPLLTRVRTTAPQELAALESQFNDPRLPELLFRYRARNHPDSLDAAARERWQAYRRRRLTGEEGLGELNLQQFQQQIDTLGAEPSDDRGRPALLQALRDWGNQLQESL